MTEHQYTPCQLCQLSSLQYGASVNQLLYPPSPTFPGRHSFHGNFSHIRPSLVLSCVIETHHGYNHAASLKHSITRATRRSSQPSEPHLCVNARRSQLHHGQFPYSQASKKNVCRRMTFYEFCDTKSMCCIRHVFEAIF